MSIRSFTAPLCAAAALVTCAMVPSTASAGEAAVVEFQRAAYAADYKSGIAKLKEMAAFDPRDVEAQFASGALQFLGAFANFQAGLYQHSNPAPSHGGALAMLTGVMPMVPGMMGPTLVPPNPNAKPMTYRVMRGLLERFVTDLAAAEAALALVKDRPVKLPLSPARIALDLNQDGTISPGERLFEAMFRRGREEQVFAFDTADASWLRGYSNVLMGTTSLFLAFDFERLYEATAHNTYGLGATALGREMRQQMKAPRSPSVVKGLLDEFQAKLTALEPQRRELTAEQQAISQKLRELPRAPEAQEQRRKLMDEQRNVQERHRLFYAEQNRLHTERQQLQMEAAGMPPGQQYAGVMDLVAAVHAMNFDVVEPARLRAVRTHLLQVMAINRNTWRLVRAETDDDREWLPNAKQTSPFGLKLTDEIIDSWIATTTLAEQVLNGEKLLPHPRFQTKGVNLKKLLEGARKVDIVSLVTGHGLLPYLENGDIVDAKTWQALTRPMQENTMMYAIWFN